MKTKYYLKAGRTQAACSTNGPWSLRAPRGRQAAHARSRGRSPPLPLIGRRHLRAGPCPSLFLPLLLFCPPPFLASEKPSSIHCSVCLGARDRTDAEDVRKQRPRGKDIDSSRGSCEGQSQAPTLGSRGQRSRRGLTDSAVAMDTGPHRFLQCGHRMPVAATVLVIARHRNRLCPAPASSKYQLPRPSPGKCTRRLVPSSAFREGRASKTATFSSAVATGSAQAGGGTSEVGRSAGLACSGVPSRLLLFSKLDPSPDGRFVFPATWWYLPGRLRL